MSKLQSGAWALSFIMLLACGDSNGDLATKKSELEEYRQELKELNAKIASLEEEIAEEDPSITTSENRATLVTTIPVPTKTFRHFLEVRGSVTSDRNVTISARTPAVVERVLVQEGERVKKGQVLIVQDAKSVRRSIDELKTSLELANTRYERQKNLWDKKIGTEIQYLEAKSNKESLERRIASAEAQQADYTIRAPFSGSVDDVIIKQGETAQPGVPMLQLVSLQDMFINADVSESYLGKFEVGDSVTVTFPSLDTSLKSTVSAIGEVINENNRTFTMEVKLPNETKLLRPNLLAVLRVEDFHQDDAVVVPTNLILSDNQGDYVFVAEEKDGQLTATKKQVKRGMTYNNETLIASGLSGSEQLIREGFRDVSEGTTIKQAENNAISSKR